MPFDIEFKNVRFTYEGSDAPALDQINLAVSPGEIVLISGPAGSGKTTLCSCILGLIPHFHDGKLEGEVIVRGYNTRRARIGGLASLVGMVFQDPESQLVTNSVADEVAFGPENLAIRREEIKARVAEALRATRLSGFEDREPHSLSGGEQQACVIAAIYAMHPEIYVMDEPLANLDPEGKAQVLKVVVELAKQRGKTLLIVEHSLEEVLPMVDRIVILDRGKIVRDGIVDEVLKSGDIPKVFQRPAIVSLGEKYRLEPLPLKSGPFYEALQAKYSLKQVHWDIPVQGSALKKGSPVIEFSNVSFSYKTPGASGNGNALNGINLTIWEGEMVAVLGRNGSGKTTAMRHVIGLQQPDSGQVRVLGLDVSETPTHQLARRVGFCFQNPNHQIVSFNVRDEIIFGLRAHNIDPSEYEDRIRKSLEFVNLLDAIDAEVFDLGKGQKQRVALASILSLDPEILIVDEPTTGQDPHMSLEIFEILKRLHERGKTILLITHHIEYAAMYAERALVLKHGQIAFDGTTRDLLEDLNLMQACSLEMPESTRLANLLRPHGVPGWLVEQSELDRAIQALIGA